MGFLDSVNNTLNRGREAAGRTGARLRLNNRITEINKSRQQLAAQLGASLYPVTKDDPNLRQGRESLYDGIAALDAEREDCQRQLNEVEAAAQAAEVQASTYTCVVCGAQVHGTDLFCASCGTPADKARPAMAPVMPPMEAQVPGGPTCSSCGAPLIEGHKFCMNCGTPVEATS